jgi:hypothetical protein
MERDARRPSDGRKLSSAWRGALLGAATIAAIALGLAVAVAIEPPHGYYGDPEELGFGIPPWTGRIAGSREVLLVVLAAGAVPGLIGGALLGWVAGKLAGAHVAERLVVLGSLVGLPVLLLVAIRLPLWPLVALPLLAGTAALERWTRGAPALRLEPRPARDHRSPG